MLSKIADIAGIAAAIFSLFAWLVSLKTRQELKQERIRLKQKVRIVLRCGGKTIPLPDLILTRAELTRSEVLGRLGMIPTKNNKRFVLTHTSDADFLADIESIRDGFKEGLLTISCTQEELEQFDLTNISTR